MVIACATDNKFVQHCSVMLTSLLCNNKGVEIYILTDGLSDANALLLNEEVVSKKGTLTICNIDSALLERFPLSSIGELAHISKATYYRLLLADILPLSINKVIYLDCDIIVDGPIDELWSVDLSDKAIAAVLQIGSGNHAERLGIPIQYGYFNAGVNVMNLDYCREHNLSEVFLDYIQEHNDNLLYNDQDVLNGVLYDKCVHVMPQWNMTPLMYDWRLRLRGDKRDGKVVNDYSDEKKNAICHRKNPSIIHYASRIKPWDKDCVSPVYKRYYEYARKTLHFNHIKPQPELSRQIAIARQFIREVLSLIKQFFHKTDQSLM